MWILGVGGIYGCGSRRWMWMESMGVAIECVCKGYIDFLILHIIISLLLL